MIFPAPIEDLVEKDWQQQILDLAHQLGWRHYHTYRSKRSPSGFPDLVLVRERVIYVEVKRETGKPTAAQVEWLDDLKRAGGEVYVWKPSMVEQIARILQVRRQEAA